MRRAGIVVALSLLASAGATAAVVPLAPAASAAATDISFGYTGASQTWTVPTGVQSAYVSMTGGSGGGTVYAGLNYAAMLNGRLVIPAGATALQVNVGGAGGWSAAGAVSTTGGWGNGFAGAAGGTATGGRAFAGGGGGGASDIRLPGAPPGQALMVAGGSGGSGGSALGYSYFGGAGTGGALAPTTGAAGQGTGGDGGSGGAPGAVAGAAATNGQNATNDNNGGGGGGGGGWVSGNGGQAGQADVISAYVGAGGGGAGGSSYADPTYVAGVTQSGTTVGSVIFTYIQATAAANQNATVGQWAKAPVASTAGTSGLTYEVASGQLPPGMTLDGDGGTLSGRPSAAGSYTFSIAVSAYLDSDYPITTVVTDNWTIAAGSGGALTTASASDVTATSASLNGTVQTGEAPVTGIACSYRTGGGSWSSDVAASPSTLPAGLDQSPVTCPVSGLTASTSYDFRFTATQSSSTLTSNTGTLRTGSPPPVVTTGAATSVTSTSAVGNGTISASRDVTSIDCRAATSLQGVATATPVAASPSSTTGVVASYPVTCSFTGLTANTLYYYGVFATDAYGTTTSTTWSDFVTAAAPPRLSAISVGSIEPTSARVSGRIWATNQNVTSIYCRAARSPGNPALGAAVAASPYTAAATARDLAVACDLTGLAAGTSYGVRMYAVDSDGTSSAGNTVTFTTGTSGGGGGGAPAPETTPTATPTVASTPVPAAAPPGLPAEPPQPTLVLPGLIVVPAGAAIPARSTLVRTEAGRTLADAPTALARRDVAFVLRVRDLPPNRTMRITLARGTNTPLRWNPIGETLVDAEGRARLPALLSTRTTTLMVRLASGGIRRYITVDVRP